MRKDIRTLLSTVHEILPKSFYKWKKVELEDLLDNQSLNKTVKKARMIFHSDRLDDKFKN